MEWFPLQINMIIYSWKLKITVSRGRIKHVKLYLAVLDTPLSTLLVEWVIYICESIPERGKKIYLLSQWVHNLHVCLCIDHIHVIQICIPWSTSLNQMESFHDLSWHVMTYDKRHVLSWKITICHDMSWNVSKYHVFQFNMVTFHDTWWYLVTFHDMNCLSI